MSFKKTLDIRWIYALLLGAALFSILSGPLDSINAPASSQLKRLFTFLRSSGRLTENGFIKTDSSILSDETNTLLNNLSSIDINLLDKAIRSYDKSKFFQDTSKINQYTLFDNLGINQNEIQFDDNKHKSINFASLPAINVKKEQQILPIIGKYITIPEKFNGLSLQPSGAIYIYELGIPTDSLYLSKIINDSQLIETRSIVKGQPYNIYFTSLNYENSTKGILIADLYGICLRDISPTKSN
jgi:hypothetical protein